MKSKRILFLATLLSLLVNTAIAAEENEILEMGLEDLKNLMQQELFSASKTTESLSGSTSAAFVLSSEEIRRSGVTSIPEALRLIPGVTVQRADANTWAVSIRGFGNKFTDKLLVLLDGRSVYNPLFTGVYWDMQDVFLEDVMSIEVIRGPGAAIWGANAVNGVINIITKSSLKTQGVQFSLASGNQDKLVTGVRYGTKLSDDLGFRLYSKFSLRDELPYTDLDERELLAPDPSKTNEIYTHTSGFRSDYEIDSSHFRVQGDATFLGGNGGGSTLVIEREPFLSGPRIDDVDASSLNLLGGYKNAISDTSQILITSYVSRDERKDGRGFEFDLTSFDLDTQLSSETFTNNQLTLGANYRRLHLSSMSADSEAVSLSPRTRSLDFSSLFLQDSQSFFDQKLKLTAGTKITYNPFSKIDYQPRLSLGYSHSAEQFFWASLSKAVRVPSIIESDATLLGASFPGALPVAVVLRPPDETRKEELVAYEVGIRDQITDWLSLDIAMFYNDYDNLVILRQSTPALLDQFAGGPALVGFGEPYWEIEAETYGVEVSLDLEVSSAWRLKGFYSHLTTELDDDIMVPFEGIRGYLYQIGPQHSASLRSLWSVNSNVDFDSNLRFVDKSTSPVRFDGSTTDTPSILQLDARLGWKFTKDYEISLIGQNLLHNRVEYNDINSFAYSAKTQKAFLVRVEGKL